MDYPPTELFAKPSILPRSVLSSNKDILASTQHDSNILHPKLAIMSAETPKKCVVVWARTNTLERGFRSGESGAEGEEDGSGSICGDEGEREEETWRTRSRKVEVPMGSRRNLRSLRTQIQAMTPSC